MTAPKSIALALAASLAAAPLAAQGIADMSAEERDVFREEVRAYLLENPEVLMDAIGVLEARQAEAEAAQDLALVAAYSDALFNSPLDWETGNPEGDIVLVEFLDYRCGYCRRAFPEVTQLIETDGNIRLIVKELPVLGAQSVLASQFALSARLNFGDQAYQDVHEALMVMRADVTEESLARLAEGLDLDAEAILEDLEAPEVTQVLNANRQLAQAMFITGTPTFVMNDTLLRGYLPYAQMAQMVEEMRADAEN